MIFYKGNGKKECELSKSQLCPARSNRRPLLVRLSLYLPFPAAFPENFHFLFLFVFSTFVFFVSFLLGSFFPVILPIFFLFLQSWYLYFALPFCFLPTNVFCFFCDYCFFICPPPPELTDVLCACMKKTHYFCFIYWSHIAIALISR